jgi:hypothetical protein
MANNHQQYEQLKKLIEEYHNPKLVRPEESPNENIIYHIYDSGNITYQKGGWAYLRRSEFTDSHLCVKISYPELFPMGTKYSSYAIVTEEHAKIIQSLMKEMEN